MCNCLYPQVEKNMPNLLKAAIGTPKSVLADIQKEGIRLTLNNDMRFSTLTDIPKALLADFFFVVNGTEPAVLLNDNFETILRKKRKEKWKTREGMAGAASNVGLTISPETITSIEKGSNKHQYYLSSFMVYLAVIGFDLVLIPKMDDILKLINL